MSLQLVHLDIYILNFQSEIGAKANISHSKVKTNKKLWDISKLPSYCMIAAPASYQFLLTTSQFVLCVSGISAGSVVKPRSWLVSLLDYKVVSLIAVQGSAPGNTGLTHA